MGEVRRGVYLNCVEKPWGGHCRQILRDEGFARHAVLRQQVLRFGGNQREGTFDKLCYPGRIGCAVTIALRVIIKKCFGETLEFRPFLLG